ncbi:MAG: response regulator [Candidatus Sericytochromatia bacterium]|nr:response regulator [Candidatus Sericytochromatia bacterium]
MASILLVEDNPDTVDFLARRLRDRGYHVMVARNGVDALRLSIERRPDAVVMDVNLPQMDGDVVARHLRDHPATAHIPIVFVTAETSRRVADLLAAGNTICLEKAIKTQAVVDALETLLPR